ncbi:MAG: energy-coupling factor transporter transmembrane protein EcfT [Ruminococcaceae bacterium]|nr:energy-coupling factor transporter transmembrane protein EcfT [Oscillospiraceae bacterium]
MLKDMTLGQFFPGNSILHKMDPRMKIIVSVIFIVSVFSAKNIFSFALLLVFTFGMVAVSGIKPSVVLKGIKPIMLIVIFTAVINLFWTQGNIPVLELGIVKIYLEGIVNAVFMMVRILTLIMGTSLLLSYTTSPISLTDGLENLMNPLKKIKVPVHEFTMMMTIALRFIPTLIEETEKIINAQKARGADFESGNILKRAKALVPILIPLFISAFRRADELAVAMECRCYHGGEGRTKMKSLHLSTADFVCLTIIVAFLCGIIVLNYISTTYTLSL